MKAKNILMTLLLVMGAIAAKASGYPPELALVSQPVMVYNYNSVTVYYDVENIGDHTYRGYVYIYLDPDYGYYYAKKHVKVCPGRIKRIAIDIPAYSMSPSRAFTIMPYYELDRELYSFTTFEYFEPVRFFWDGPRNEPWVVVTLPPRPRYYHRPGSYRYYYDGFRPPMPPPGHGPGMPPPPMNPMHHTYNYHHNNGGYPANHFNGAPGNHFNEGTPPPAPENNSNNLVAPNATVRPNPNAGSMSGNHNNGNSNPPATNNGSSSGNVNRPSDNSNSGTARPANNGSSSGNVSRPSSNNSSTRPANNGSSSGNVSRPSSNSNNSSTRPANNGSSSGSVSRPSSNSNNSSTRPANNGSSNGSVSRPSSSNNNSGTARPSSSSGSSSRGSSSSSSSRTSTGSATGSGRR
ncbi:MAG: hypothetical protein K6G25_05830 [Bacteroidales bacterium]|nr:hypothetical protein [Bacteroidales bacterium]